MSHTARHTLRQLGKIATIGAAIGGAMGDCGSSWGAVRSYSDASAPDCNALSSHELRTFNASACLARLGTPYVSYGELATIVGKSATEV